MQNVKLSLGVRSHLVELVCLPLRHFIVSTHTHSNLRLWSNRARSLSSVLSLLCQFDLCLYSRVSSLSTTLFFIFLAVLFLICSQFSLPLSSHLLPLHYFIAICLLFNARERRTDRLTLWHTNTERERESTKIERQTKKRRRTCKEKNIKGGKTKEKKYKYF